MGMTLNEFIETYEGKRVGVFSDNKGQCVALVQLYLRDCLDYPESEIPLGDAKYWKNYLVNQGIAEKVNIPKPGDIVVCPNKGELSDGVHGHIGIVANNKKMMFEQNLCMYSNGENPDMYVVKTARIKRDFNNFIEGDSKYAIYRPINKNIVDEPEKSTQETGLRLEAVGSPFRVRNKAYDGYEKARVEPGDYASIKEFGTKFEKDKYQWAKVNYHGEDGYAQLDLCRAYKIVELPSNKNTCYLRAQNSKYYIRKSSSKNATIITEVPKGKEAKIISFESMHASDGYQWAYVDYDGIRGYAQMDPKNFNMIVM